MKTQTHQLPQCARLIPRILDISWLAEDTLEKLPSSALVVALRRAVQDAHAQRPRYAFYTQHPVALPER